MANKNIPSIKLNNGIVIPGIGFGTWQNKDAQECIETINIALKDGYRHIDSAQIYANEEYVGQAVKASGLKRDEIFITTKISVTNFRAGRVIPSFEESLKKLDMDYVDLLLLHFPVTGLRDKAWLKLEEINASGKAKAIGVSNYTIKHLERLSRNARVVPAINQVELHVFLQQPKLLDYCRERGIIVEAYSPIAHGYGLSDPTLAKIGAKYRKSPAQIMIRWCIQVGTIPLPKSVNPKRISENIEVFDFELSDQDMNELAKLDKNHRTCWDPTLVP